MMPVRKRTDRRANRVEFDVTAEMMVAFRAYNAGNLEGPEHWRLHDLLHDPGALAVPFIHPCCFHPDITGMRWSVLPDAVAIYRAAGCCRLVHAPFRLLGFAQPPRPLAALPNERVFGELSELL